MTEIIVTVFAAAAAFFDIKTRRIPNKLLLIMLAVWLLLLTHELFVNSSVILMKLLDAALGFLLGGGIFLAVYFASRKNLGAGDVKFMAVAGLYLGFGSTIPAIFYGTTLAALTGLILILFKKITRKDMLPLAPFLLAGIALTVFIQ